MNRIVWLTGVLFAGISCAQEFRATISGVVADPTGAPVPAARVTVTNAATNVSTSTATNSAGVYAVPYLGSGTYQVSVAAQGFDTVVRQGIEVHVEEKLKLDFQLQIGAVRSEVTISAAPPLINTATATSGQIVDRRSIAELPLPDGNPDQLVLLDPGAVYTGTGLQFNRLIDVKHSSSITVNGAPGANEFTINGTPDMAITSTSGGGGNNSTAFIPPSDAVEEFKLASSRFDAQYGHTAGSDINTVVKSGGNALHGDVYEFDRNTVLFTKDFFANATGGDKPILHYNRWGGSVGGPVYVPRIYNGKNKTFFFFAFQYFNQQAPTPGLATVPTTAEEKGDFSALQPLGVTIYNPYSATPASGGLVQRTPFPGNLIPASLLSPIAAKIIQYYPAPNVTGNAYGQNNFFGQPNTGDRYNSEIGRIDETISDKDRAMFSFFRLGRTTFGGHQWTGTVNGTVPSGDDTTRPSDGLTYDHVHVLSPATVLDARAGFISWVQRNIPGTQGAVNFPALGFSPAVAANFLDAQFLPQIDVTNLGTGSYGLGWNGPDSLRSMIYTLQPTLMKTAGHHTLRLGYDFRAYRLTSSNLHCVAGCYTFASTYTNGPLSTSSAAPIGQDIAALVLGQPTGGQISRNGSFADQSLYNSAFLQDDWKITKKLTLNLGLRYEYEAPPTERYNRNTRGFDPTSPNPIQGAAQAAYAAHPIAAVAPANFKVPGGYMFAGPRSRGFFDGDTNNIQPRIGIAYGWNDKTAIRAGWGMFMAPNTIVGVNQPGFSQNTSLVPSLDGGLNLVANLANPFPSGVINPAGSSLGLATNLGQSVTTYPVQQRNGLSQSWQFDVQRELPQHVLVDAAYVGTYGYDLPGSTGILGAIPLQYLSTSPVRDNAVISFLGANVANPFQGLTPGGSLNGSSVKQSQLLLRYPEFTNVNTTRFDGSTRYHALQVRLQRRFSGGISILATYAWSKLMEHDFFINPQDTAFASSISPDDVTQRFVFSGIWEVPLGKGRRFGSSWRGPLNAVLGGWQGNWIYMAQSGFPLQWGNVYYNGNPDSLRAHVTGSTVRTGTFDTGGFYFSDAAVQKNGQVSPALQRSDSRINLSNNYRTFPMYLPGFRGQGQNTVDIEAMKRFYLGETRNLEVRCDFLNAFNHPEFSNPVLSPTSGSFGQVTSQANFPRNIQVGMWLNF